MTQEKTGVKDKLRNGIGREEAQALFVAGKELHDIARLASVTEKTLQRWARQEQWEAKRKLAEGSPRMLHETLHGILRAKFMRLMKGKRVPQWQVKEMVQFITLIDRFLGEIWDVRAAISEVMRLFSEFIRLRQIDQGDLGQVSRLVQEFFTEVEKRNLHQHGWRL